MDIATATTTCTTTHQHLCNGYLYRHVVEMHAYIFTARTQILIWKVLWCFGSVQINNVDRVYDMCKIRSRTTRTHRNHASIFDFLVRYFIHHKYTYAKCYREIIDFFGAAYFCWQQRTCVWCSLHALVFLRRKFNCSAKMRCSAFPIFTICRTASQSAQCALVLCVQIAKSGNGLNARLRVRLSTHVCASVSARIFSRPPKIKR